MFKGNVLAVQGEMRLTAGEVEAVGGFEMRGHGSCRKPKCHHQQIEGSDCEFHRDQEAGEYPPDRCCRQAHFASPFGIAGTYRC